MSRSLLMVLSERIYRMLIVLYPAHFRLSYRESMVQVFRDVSRDTYHQRGLAALAVWWCVALLDLIRTAVEQRREGVVSRPTLMSAKSAAVISLLLCLPFYSFYLTAVLDIKPAFMLNLLTIDGYQPTTLGRIVMLIQLIGLPVAFLINLLPMVRRADPKREMQFTPPPTHYLVGASVLLVEVITLKDMMLYELRPFVAPLGSSAVLGQILFLLGLLALPAAFLLNRFPRFAGAGSGRVLTFQPTSINLIIGAAILLAILMVVSAFGLEAAACSIGVPNCD